MGWGEGGQCLQPDRKISVFLTTSLTSIYHFPIYRISILEETTKCLSVPLLLQIYLRRFWHIWEQFDIYICDRSNIKMSIKARWNTLAKLHSNTLKTFCSEVRGQLIPLPRKYTEIQSNTHSNTLKCPQIHSKLLAITAAALGKLFTVVFAKSQKLQTFKLNSYHMCTLQCAQYRSIRKSINYQTIH